MNGGINKKDWIKACIYVPLMFYQFYLSFIYYNNLGLDWLTNLGWYILTISAVFGWLPIYEFRKHGNVPEGKSYVHTTKIVTTGVYSIVRHPQFLAGILITISMMLISQHLHSFFAGVIAAIIYASDVPDEDKENIRKFGESYENYMNEVPALNFIVGLIKKFYR